MRFAGAATIIAAALLALAPCADAADRKLTLKLRQKLDKPSPLAQAVYLHPTGLELIAVGGFSPDNGRTWEAFTPTPDFDSKLPHGYRREKFPLFVDPSNGRVVSIINSMDTPGVNPDEIEPPVALETYYLRYRVSLDGGRTYLFDEPIVIDGGEFTPEHPFPGVWKNKNAIFMGDFGSLLTRTRAGKILVPAQACLLGPDGKLANPGGGFTWTDVRILIGSWTDGNKLKWEAAESVQVAPEISTRGMIEPTLAELPDGRILMIMRGSNGGRKDPRFQIPGVKFFSLSSDGGYHWTKPDPWKYADGATLYSPGSMSQLLPHSSGRLFWIGNVNPTNPRGNSPRYPMVVGEVDAKSLGLIRESILVIDDLRAEDTAGAELCAHTPVFEDRESGDLVIPMLRWTGKYEKNEPYLYRVGTRP